MAMMPSHDMPHDRLAALIEDTASTRDVNTVYAHLTQQISNFHNITPDELDSGLRHAARQSFQAHMRALVMIFPWTDDGEQIPAFKPSYRNFATLVADMPETLRRRTARDRKFRANAIAQFTQERLAVQVKVEALLNAERTSEQHRAEVGPGRGL